MVSFNRKRLTTYRTRYSLTVPALARKIGVSSQQVYRWERGQSTPTMRQFCKVLDRLHLRADPFFLYPVRRVKRQLEAEPTSTNELPVTQAC